MLVYFSAGGCTSRCAWGRGWGWHCSLTTWQIFYVIHFSSEIMEHVIVYIYIYIYIYIYQCSCKHCYVLGIFMARFLSHGFEIKTWTINMASGSAPSNEKFWVHASILLCWLLQFGFCMAVSKLEINVLIDWSCLCSCALHCGEHAAGSEPIGWGAACCTNRRHRDGAMWTGITQYWVPQHTGWPWFAIWHEKRTCT